jgi:hypothetical protein
MALSQDGVGPGACEVFRHAKNASVVQNALVTLDAIVSIQRRQSLNEIHSSDAHC